MEPRVLIRGVHQCSTCFSFSTHNLVIFKERLVNYSIVVYYFVAYACFSQQVRVLSLTT